MVSVFRISVYDKDRKFRGQVGDPISLEATPRFNALGTCRMVIPLGHKMFSELYKDGARLRVEFRGEHLISGPVVDDEQFSDGIGGTYSVTIADDFGILQQDITGWPVPASAITAQSASEYRTYTGNAETIIKTAVTENGVTRMGIPGLVVAPNLNRGAVIPGGVAIRMHYLADKLFPAVTQAGLGVSVKQVGEQLRLDVYEPTTHVHSLSVKGRTLKDITVTRKRPTSTRVIVGGQGEGTARKFRMVTDPAREAQYGFKSETFRDARDNDDNATMDARAQETLTEEGPQNGVAITLAGSGIFQYGPGGFRVGDRVPIKITDTQTVTEVIRECTLKWVSKDYASAEPIVGDLTNKPERVTAQRMASLAKRQRDQEAR